MGLRRWDALRDERGGQLRLEHRDEDRAEYGQAEARTVVADGLGDARRLTVGGLRSAVERIGVGLAEHEPHAGAREHDAPHLLADRERVDPAGPQREPDAGQRAAQHDGPTGADPVEHPAADLRGDDVSDEEVQQRQARRGRLLAQRDLRVLAGEEEHRHEHRHRQSEDHVLRGERRGR